MSRTLMARIGYVFAKGAFDRLREKMDVRKVNGGVFLGLNGIVVKSHGGTDAEGFAAAVELGYEMVRARLLEGIGQEMARYHGREAGHARLSRGETGTANKG
jgi:phosphate acyltransferase